MRRTICWTALVPLTLCAAVLFAQDGPQKARIKKIDSDQNTVTLTLGDKDRTFEVTPRTRLVGANNTELTQRLQSPELKPRTTRADCDAHHRGRSCP